VAVKNPVTLAIRGLFVAVALLLASIPAFPGLVVVMPVPGHATWHLYRAVVVHEPVAPGWKWVSSRRVKSPDWRAHGGAGLRRGRDYGGGGI
jgi:hypothetical protein